MMPRLRPNPSHRRLGELLAELASCLAPAWFRRPARRLTEVLSRAWLLAVLVVAGVDAQQLVSCQAMSAGLACFAGCRSRRESPPNSALKLTGFMVRGSGVAASRASPKAAWMSGRKSRTGPPAA